MKQCIFLFNPDNDLALAHGGGHYVAPPFAQKMQADLCTLPMWYAPPGSAVLVPNEAVREWVDEASRRCGLSVRGITPHELPHATDAQFCPWGWSGTIKQRLTRLGVGAHLLPSDTALECIRQLAHRRSSIAMHRFIGSRTALPLSPTPCELTVHADVLRFAKAHPGCYVKMPWSGCGQGVYHAIDPSTAAFEQWCRGALRRQGSLLCEVGLDRILDFALEYRCHGGNAELVGYSVFESDFHSQYGGGIVAQREQLLHIITGKYPDFPEIIPIVSQAVSHIYAGSYDGFLGVDMLLYDHHGATMLNPCVEVNLRATMGLVAGMAGERLTPTAGTGAFKIEYSKTGFSTSGKNRLLLTPVMPDTQYCAYIDWD